MILDEGHKIKNPSTKVAKAVREVPAHHRFILSGTPVQNNLSELWALFDFVTVGEVLGDRKAFKAEFSEKIEAGSDKRATDRQKRVSAIVAEELRMLIKPHFLRRDKKFVQEKYKECEEPPSADDALSRMAQLHHAPTPTLAKSQVQKNDFVVWTYLSPVQKKLYEGFLDSEEVKEALNSTKSPLAAISVLKKICDHPRLLHEEMKSCRSLASLLPSTQKYDMHLETMLGESGKLAILESLLKNLIENKHRILVFSQSKKMLDIIEIVLNHAKIALLRIDGDIPTAEERQVIMDRFNRDMRVSVCLLTSQTGGLGINLTSADRVVIFDPWWNPARDDQAVVSVCDFCLLFLSSSHHLFSF